MPRAENNHTVKAVKRSAPKVKRVIVTSSFAAVLDEKHLSGRLPHPSPKSAWNPVGTQDLQASPTTAYRLSKTLAEKAAWGLLWPASSPASTWPPSICPPVVFGPVVAHHLALASPRGHGHQQRLVQRARRGPRRRPLEPRDPRHGGPVTVWVDVREGKLPGRHVDGGGAPPASENFRYNNDVTTRVARHGMDQPGVQHHRLDTVAQGTWHLSKGARHTPKRAKGAR